MIGLLGKKLGMSALFDNGKHIPVTVIAAGPCPVTQVKTVATDGYEALQLAFDPVRPTKVAKPRIGHFKRAGVEPHRLVQEFRNFGLEVKAGDVLKVDLFKPGDTVNVIGVSKGRGFAGVVRRYKFGRPNQSHGTHENFRGAGSIGAGSFPGRVFPGLRMAGQLGHKRITVKNLKVVGVHPEQGLLVLKGAVPGAIGGYLAVRKVK